MNNYLPNKLSAFIWYFLKPYKITVVVFTFLAIIAGFWGPFNSILIKNVIDLLPKVHSGDINILIMPVSLIILNFIVFDNFTWRLLTYIQCKYYPIIINNIIGKLTDHVFGQSHQFFQDNLSGK